MGIKVINIDEIECQKYEHCEKCKGSHETLKYSKCKIGYKLNANKIGIKQKCNIEEKEKCKDCNNNEGKENQCISCNKGYYLPVYSSNRTICTKCKIEGCKTCNIFDGSCQKYKEYYEPLINNGKIIECNLICDLGEGNKCLTCDLENKNKCGICNSGYKLMKDGTCKKIENYLIANYNVISINNPTYIMNLFGNQINFSNKKMHINYKRVFPYIIYTDLFKLDERFELHILTFEKIVLCLINFQN